LLSESSTDTVSRCEYGTWWTNTDRRKEYRTVSWPEPRLNLAPATARYGRATDTAVTVITIVSLRTQQWQDSCNHPPACSSDPLQLNSVGQQQQQQQQTATHMATEHVHTLFLAKLNGGKTVTVHGTKAYGEGEERYSSTHS
jgi:hypothetical protein